MLAFKAPGEDISYYLPPAVIGVQLQNTGLRLAGRSSFQSLPLSLKGRKGFRYTGEKEGFPGPEALVKRWPTGLNLAVVWGRRTLRSLALPRDTQKGDAAHRRLEAGGGGPRRPGRDIWSPSQKAGSHDGIRSRGGQAENSAHEILKKLESSGPGGLPGGCWW